ncbi:hypothetical protein HOY80DRAFT_952352 [Tuber brumale]|nr:hypothetical protein HOY80DRAFT_952352 [Tuber brumale]
MIRLFTHSSLITFSTFPFISSILRGEPIGYSFCILTIILPSVIILEQKPGEFGRFSFLFLFFSKLGGKGGAAFCIISWPILVILQ